MTKQEGQKASAFVNCVIFWFIDFGGLYLAKNAFSAPPDPNPLKWLQKPDQLLAHAGVCQVPRAAAWLFLINANQVLMHPLFPGPGVT